MDFRKELKRHLYAWRSRSEVSYDETRGMTVRRRNPLTYSERLADFDYIQQAIERIDTRLSYGVLTCAMEALSTCEGTVDWWHKMPPSEPGDGPIHINVIQMPACTAHAVAQDLLDRGWVKGEFQRDTGQ